MNVMTRSTEEAAAAPGAGGNRIDKLRSLSIGRDTGDRPGQERPAAAVTRPVAERRRPPWLPILVGVQAVAIGWLALGGAADKDPSREAPAKAAPAKVSNSAGPGIQFEAQGFIAATRRATVSTRVAGIVTSVRVEAGDRVVRGQVLGTLDTELARRDLQQASSQLGVLQARLRSAEAQRVQAVGDRDREQALFDRQFSTRARQIQAQTAAAVAGASVDSARADLAVAALQVQQQRSVLANYTILAPFSGIVTEKNAQTGELIAPTGAGGGFTRTGLCTIVDMDSLEVVVDVNEQMITRVRAGQPVSISLYAYPDAKFAGRVSRIMPSADRAKGTLQVRIMLTDRDARILPDMGARVAFL